MAQIVPLQAMLAAVRAKAPGAMPPNQAELDATPAKQLATVLAELPEPWHVLRNRRIAGADGPPWVKYVALHPELGIALVDAPPGRPAIAVAPLQDFLARVGFDASYPGYLPIVAVEIGKEEISETAERLDAAFSALPACEIGDPRWSDVVSELLLRAEGLIMTRLPRPRKKSPTEASARPAEPARAEQQPRTEPLAKAPSAREAPPEPRPAPRVKLAEEEMRVGRPTRPRRPKADSKVPKPSVPAASVEKREASPAPPPAPAAKPAGEPDRPAAPQPAAAGARPEKPVQVRSAPEPGITTTISVCPAEAAAQRASDDDAPIRTALKGEVEEALSARGSQDEPPSEAPPPPLAPAAPTSDRLSLEPEPAFDAARSYRGRSYRSRATGPVIIAAFLSIAAAIVIVVAPHLRQAIHSLRPILAELPRPQTNAPPPPVAAPAPPLPAPAPTAAAPTPSPSPPPPPPPPKPSAETTEAAVEPPPPPPPQPATRSAPHPSKTKTAPSKTAPVKKAAPVVRAQPVEPATVRQPTKRYDGPPIDAADLPPLDAPLPPPPRD